MEAVDVRDRLHRHYLRQFPDVSALTKKLDQSKVSLEDCYRLYRAVQLIGPVLEALEPFKENKSLASLVTVSLHIKQVFIYN